MTPPKEHCPKDSVIDTPEECEIAHRKFDQPTNTYKDDKQAANLPFPAGCYCTTYGSYDCAETKFNELLDTSGTIEEGAGICRIRG